jgi:hypothetical protein
MAKKSKHEKLGHSLASELGLELQDRCLPLKKVQGMIRGAQSFYFVYDQNGDWYYDTAEIWRETLGCRIKPERFLMHPTIKSQLETRKYTHWYFQYEQKLYRVQIAKTTDLFDRLWFKVCDDGLHKTNVLVELDAMFLRKKPLMHLRESQLPWYDEPYHDIDVRKRA